MSQRNTLENKRLRREVKKKRTPLPARIDLIDWIKLRSNVTTGTATKLILSGVLRADSHNLGFRKEKKTTIFDPVVSAELRDRITIHSPLEPE